MALHESYSIQAAYLEGCISLADGCECRLPLLQQGAFLCMHGCHVLGSPGQRLTSIFAVLHGPSVLNINIAPPCSTLDDN